MPELPEVETVRRGLDELIVGRTIRQLDVKNPKSFLASSGDAKAFLLNAKILKVRRRAKVLLIDLDSKYSLMVHLKMTGQMIFVGEKRFGAGHPNDSFLHDLPDKSTRIVFIFDDNSQLFFNDQRKFGWVKLLPTAQIKNDNFMQKVGPEPLEKTFNWQQLKTNLQRRARTSIKAALLDQTVLAGIGNIYADEVLFAAGIYPERLVGSLSDLEIKNLQQQIVRILSLAIQKGGSTDRNYVDAKGERGSYLSFAKVFRRQNLACLTCGNLIEKIRVAGRGTHFCPTCQPKKS